MRIEKNKHSITSLATWEQFAGPKSPDQWVEGRSAFELARAWLGSGIPEMPAELRALLDSRAETRGIVPEVILPEHRITFDARSGEPRNADLAFSGQVGLETIAVTVEAKADEPFGATVSETVADALERSIQNERSGGVDRVRDLVRALLRARDKGVPHLGGLRYQLLTAVAGTLAFAVNIQARYAVLVIHEFVTTRTTPERHEQNSRDYRAFLHRFAGAPVPEIAGLSGPFTVPGRPLFAEAPPLFVGKVTKVCA